MKNIINKFKNLDKSIKRTIIGGIVIVLILFVVVLLIGLWNNRQLSYAKLETKINKAAQKYYEVRDEKLPKVDGTEVKISVDKLVEAGYLKELSKYNDDNCSADIYVEYNNGEYLYSVELQCDHYSTNTLASYIQKNEPIVSSKDGLYQYGNEFIYRGENVNNYILFSDNLWRILRINEDGTIRIIANDVYEKLEWDDRYNIDADDTIGINDFEVSRVKDYLNAYGNNTEYIKKPNKKYIVAKNVCLDKISNLDFSNIASLACSNYSTEKYQFSLIQLNEYFITSVDPNCNNISSESCTNYNYLARGRYWTITPSKLDSSKVYTTGTSTKAVEAEYTYNIRVVTNLSSHIIYSAGKGSKKNPYTFKLS